ncbi:unannotated protein [freshwater metagenome]|uniref:Unannotated protein n=1 Tax=freshwater metagenome TaxID=449393 RepID=A0A6J6QN73_9ZZZZ
MVPPMLPTPGRYPNGHLLAWYVTNRQTPRDFWIFLPSASMPRPIPRLGLVNLNAAAEGTGFKVCAKRWSQMT